MAGRPKSKDATSLPPALRQAYERGVVHRFAEAVYDQCVSTMPTALEPAPDDLPIDELRLATRAYNKLKARSYDTVGRIAAAASIDLLDIPYFGPRQLENVIVRLYVVGRTLSDLQKRDTES